MSITTNVTIRRVAEEALQLASESILESLSGESEEPYLNRLRPLGRYAALGIAELAFMPENAGKGYSCRVLVFQDYREQGGGCYVSIGRRVFVGATAHWESDKQVAMTHITHWAYLPDGPSD